MKIGIVIFCPEATPEVLVSLKGLSALIPKNTEYQFVDFICDQDLNKFDALILTGSCLSAFAFQEMIKKNKMIGDYYFQVHKTFKKLLEYKKPMLGICFGAQIIALLNDGKIGHLSETEFGFLEHEMTDDGKIDPVFGCLPNVFYGAHAHDDYVDKLPLPPEVKSSTIIATRNNYIHAYKIVCKNNVVCYGVQPHPEMSSTSYKATYMVKMNEEKIKNMIGQKAYKKIIALPETATFELPKVIPNFINKIIFTREK